MLWAFIGPQNLIDYYESYLGLLNEPLNDFSIIAQCGLQTNWLIEVPLKIKIEIYSIDNLFKLEVIFMDVFVAKLFDLFLRLTYSKRKKIVADIKLLSKVSKNEPDETMKRVHLAERKRLSFQYHAGFKARSQDVDLLIDLHNSFDKECWHLVRDAYKIWKIENGTIHTSVTASQKLTKKLLLYSFCVLGGIGILFGIIAILSVEPSAQIYFLIAYLCCAAALGLMMFIYPPYQAAVAIENKLNKKEKAELIEAV